MSSVITSIKVTTDPKLQNSTGSPSEVKWVNHNNGNSHADLRIMHKPMPRKSGEDQEETKVLV